MLAGSTPAWLSRVLVSRHKFTAWSGQPETMVETQMPWSWISQCIWRIFYNPPKNSVRVPAYPSLLHHLNQLLTGISVPLSEEKKHFFLFALCPLSDSLLLFSCFRSSTVHMFLFFFDWCGNFGLIFFHLARPEWKQRCTVTHHKDLLNLPHRKTSCYRKCPYAMKLMVSPALSFISFVLIYFLLGY